MALWFCLLAVRWGYNSLGEAAGTQSHPRWAVRWAGFSVNVGGVFCYFSSSSLHSSTLRALRAGLGGPAPRQAPGASCPSPSPAEPRGQVLRWVLCLPPPSSAWKIAPVFQEPDCLLPGSFNSQKFHHAQGSPGSRPFYPRGAFVKQAPGPGGGLGLGNIWQFLILEIS